MIYTIGHSTFKPDDFVTMSRDGDGKPLYEKLVDTRSHPGSKWEWWNKERIPGWLRQRGFEYSWVPELGGWNKTHHAMVDQLMQFGVDIRLYLGRGFPKQRIAGTVRPPQEPGWTNTGLRDYSYFTGTSSFLDKADQLIEAGQRKDLAIMCCECQWWRCHRSMISDYLAWRGVETVHIMPHMRQKAGVKFVDGPKLIPHSSIIGNRLERYEAPVKERWQKHVAALDAAPA